MTSNDFDVIVVGAGPAGAAAALTAVRAGASVCMIERGPFPGSKNMYGGVIYGRILDTLVPNWWDEMPIQRWVTRRSTMVVTDTQALTVDFRSDAWANPPYNGATAFRGEFDSWLATKATDAGATLVCDTVVTGLLREGDTVVGVRTDRPDGDLRASVVVACDGVNSFLAKEAGIYGDRDPGNYTLGVKETLALPRETIEERFAVRGDHGADIEVLGCTGDVPGGGFIYTNRDSLAVGLVLRLPELAAQKTRPEDLLADFKAHPAVAPLVEGGEVVEYSAHLIPEGGFNMMGGFATDGLLVAGDAAALCLAAGIWLEGVNFAIGSGATAGRVAAAAARKGDVSSAGLADYRRELEASFVLQDHRKLQAAPHLVLGGRSQTVYPKVACDLVEAMFRVDNPAPKPGVRKLAMATLRRHKVSLRGLVRDGRDAWRSFG